MGGIGKTELALEIADRIRNEKHIFWIDCRTELEMENNFISISRYLKMASKSAPMKEVKEVLSERDDWMLIFDNVDDESTLMFIKRNLLPSGLLGQVLFTGRLSTLPTVGKAIEVPLLNMEESKNLLNSCCPSAECLNTDGEALVCKLGHLPLAIEQAGIYMEANSMHIREYLHEYQKEAENRALLFEEGPASIYSPPILLT
jgi:hypothetical protein